MNLNNIMVKQVMLGLRRYKTSYVLWRELMSMVRETRQLRIVGTKGYQPLHLP